ncbi:hypothetical protein PAPYR_11052 [Paratrimastix pyriformis]|uniref:DNA-directed DNA polymerase n=1 Tax=Paratrimastix pyriformis TaxID=342808 RepID=A0ABQ8UAD9_9EUKA|nr:hypothetical protein PAPYR_11052 [Paratrimastix pyriformis]
MAAPYKGSGLAYVYSSLFGLRVHMVDMMYWAKTLDTILGALKLPLKQRHNMSYAVMNKIMMDPNAATENPEHCLENIIRYCVYDAEAVLHIADKMDYLEKMRCFIEVTGITLSTYFTRTQAAWGMMKLARTAWRCRDHVSLKWNYGELGEKNGKYKGAVNWSENNDLADTPCMMFDFAGLYPSMMRAYAVSPFSYVATVDDLAEVYQDGHHTPENTTFVRNPTEQEVEASKESNKGVTNPLTLFREDILKQYTVFEIREHDPFLDTVSDFVDQRSHHKALLKDARKRNDAAGVKYHNTMQYCFKIMANSLYGLLGSPFACYMFNEKCAAAVTTAARDAIMRASSIASSYGKRLFIDTDSTAVQLAQEHQPPLDFSTQAGVDAFNGWVARMQTEINSQLQQSYIEVNMFPSAHLRYISFAFEAVFTRAFFAQRKTYFKLQIPGDGVKVGVEPEFSYKGCQFAIQTAYVRDRTLTLLRRLLEIPAAKHPECLARFYAEEERNCRENILLYARKQKLSGKDRKVKSLLARFPDLKNQDFCRIVRINHSGKSGSDAWAPIDEEHIPAGINIVDTLIQAYSSNISRYFPIWKLITPKSQTFTEKGGEILDRSELMFQVETLGGKRTMRNASADEIEELLLSGRDKQTVHEIIGVAEHKAYFDIESAGRIPIAGIIAAVERILGKGVVTCYSACGPKKQSYHLVCNVVVTRRFNLVLANYLSNVCGFDCVDTGVYSKDHCMRCFTQDKIVTVDGQRCFDHRVVHLPSDPECEHVTEEQLLSSLITYTCDVPNFDMQAMDFSENLINVPEMRFSVEGSNLPVSLQKYLEDVFGEYEVQEAGDDRLRIAPKHPYHCRICDREHGKDGGWISRSATSYLFHCSRNHEKDKYERFEVASSVTFHQKLQAYAEKCPPFVHDHRADEFLTFDPVKPLTCVKARMGSGKTQNLTRILTHEQPNSKVVMISCRRTLAFDFMKRYQAEGSLPFESYLDIKEHDISVRRHPRLIIQIDSLGRIIAHDLGAQTAEQKPIDFLILDEVESLLNQLKSANNTKVVQVLRELMVHAHKVVAMDGLLQDSTVRMLEVLCGCPAERIEFNKDMPEYHVKTVQTMFKQSKENRGLTFVTETIARMLAEGKRVACFMSIRKVMESVKAYISETMPDVKIMTFSGKDKEMQETETEGVFESHYKQKRTVISGDINEHLVRHDIRLFMYTSTITAGVDINVPHFDTFVHVLSSNMNPIETAQAIFRVRNYKQRAGIIAYQRGNGACDTQTLEQLMALGNTVESAFACGRCNWTLPQQVLAMLGARHTELVSKAMEFIVSALKQHHYTLEFTDLVKPEIAPVALAEQHMDQRIITLLGWAKSAEGVWDQHRTWAPAPEELAHLGQQNDAAHLVACTDPLFEEKDAWAVMVRDLGMEPKKGEGLDIAPDDVERYHNKETRSAYHKLIRAQAESGGPAAITRGVVMLRHAHDKCTGAATVTTLPEGTRPDIGRQIQTVAGRTIEAVNGEGAAQAAGFITIGQRSVVPQLTRAVDLEIAERIIEIGREKGMTLTFSQSKELQNAAANAALEYLETRKDDLKRLHIISRWDRRNAHHTIVSVLERVGHPVSKPKPERKRVGGELVRFYTVDLE